MGVSHPSEFDEKLPSSDIEQSLRMGVCRPTDFDLGGDLSVFGLISMEVSHVDGRICIWGGWRAEKM